ncbi:DNA-directed RNA polymerase I subunit, RPA12 [Guillardia theta CCMP2712]|uniref:DNA-directed RNA polymerase I subunit RPA12 n=1 Tax=Guillardia theta (strain CCMP2712) TaxID=905079 RepID=L1IQC7_GUITC|nr:DNA-directed RNA polymerase I subunit, RPA12 [Guillardia theta CCMP2712]EKX38496.1 DNA-directed RNA polymerase I subunit, RPA12 [Guillardia theta CCMP2712]|eukprot:XP_005825476.1 DNA-directed RNA polymerase I subunit, RPA12 [Guillardia theta CCMP2712]
MFLGRETVCHLSICRVFLTSLQITQSKPKFNVAALLQEVDGEQDGRATVEENCPKCNNHEAKYSTLQMRSADEGQTIFYECTKCGHVWSVNA